MNFKVQLVEAFKEGLLLAVKYSTIIVIILFVINYILTIRQMASNGNEAAEALIEYQKAGYLPRFPLSKKE